MEEYILSFMDQYGYIGVMLLIMAENIFPPIPSEVILTFAGFMTTKGEMTLWGVVIASTVGAVLGALILYLLGSIFDRKTWEKIITKYGKYLRLKTEDIEKAENWFEKHGNKTVFFCRFIPLIRSLISIPAGMAKMKITHFILLTTAGTLIWNTVLIYLGSRIGEQWEEIVAYMDIYSNAAYTVIAIVGISVIVWFYKKRIKGTIAKNKTK